MGQNEGQQKQANDELLNEGEMEKLVAFLEHGGEDILLKIFSRRQMNLERKLINTDEMFELHRFQGRIKESMEMSNIIKTWRQKFDSKLENDE